MEKIRSRFRPNMAAGIIGAIVLLLAIFGVIVSAIGYISFTNAFKSEYAVSTYHMADTAAAFVDGGALETYLEGGMAEEYEETKAYLDTCCDRMNVSLIYVIVVDRSDYGRFESVFNAVNNSVDNSDYKAWELGHKRNTTNDEYREKYRALYEGREAYETVYRTNPTDGQHPHITTMVPVKASDGSVTGILCMQRPVRELDDVRKPYLARIAVSTCVLAAAAAAMIALFIRKQVVSPVKRVSDEAVRFAKENTKAEPLGNISRYKEIAALASSIDTMETDMVDYIGNLTRITAEREHIETELGLATRLQEAFLPNSFPAFPGRGEFDVYASMDPAKAVGGDFYDFYLIDDDHLCLLIADVSGKGIPAALFMMVSKIILQSCAMLGQTPGEVLTKTNEAICSNNRENMFVTVWIGILELSTGRLTCANAGHEYPTLMRKGGGFELIKDKHGLVIGAMDGVKYDEYELTLSPGDKLFVYTDGVPEANDSENKLFGTERMLEALNAEPGAAPERILGNVRAAVDVFVAEAEQFDDLTMLCMEYKGKEGAL
jgi:sigma-B regulation protein RsbU (phosphoserine phosphatase)